MGKKLTQSYQITGPTHIAIYKNLVQGQSSPEQIVFDLGPYKQGELPVKITHIKAAKKQSGLLKFSGLVVIKGKVIKIKGEYEVGHPLGAVKLTEEQYEYFTCEDTCLLEDE